MIMKLMRIQWACIVSPILNLTHSQIFSCDVVFLSHCAELGQAYDGASNMYGKWNGLATKIRNDSISCSSSSTLFGTLPQGHILQFLWDALDTVKKTAKLIKTHPKEHIYWQRNWHNLKNLELTSNCSVLPDGLLGPGQLVLFWWTTQFQWKHWKKYIRQHMMTMN